MRMSSRLDAMAAITSSQFHALARGDRAVASFWGRDADRTWARYRGRL